MAIIGAIIGDIAGSQYEFSPAKISDYKYCELFTDRCFFTDDTVMTLAVKEAILNNAPFAETFRKFGREYDDRGYGTMFYEWLQDKSMGPYNSYGNGSAMRCSYIGEHFDTEKDVIVWAKKSAECTHNHPEGIKGAIVTAMCVYMARTGASKNEILKYATEQYPKTDYKYSAEYGLDEYRDRYEWSGSCQGSVPVAIRCFFESDDYESFIRNVFSLYCDRDTLAAIGGGIAEEFYHGTGFNEDELLKRYLLKRHSLKRYLDENLYEIVKM